MLFVVYTEQCYSAIIVVEKTAMANVGLD